MKPLPFSTNRRKQLIGSSLFLAGMTWVCTQPALAGTPAPATEPAPTPATNWVDFTIGGYMSEGDSNDAALQRRWQNNDDFFGGIESFHFGQEIGGGTFTADGHALFGLDDYEVDLKYTKDDVGYIRGGYREFRTWSDGSGGYLPGASTPLDWINPITEYGDDLHVDRGEVFFEAGLTMEKLPTIIFGYTHRWRDGQKDSTMWGIENSLTTYGLNYAPASSNDRGVAPTLSDLDETSDIFTLDMDHSIGNTDLGMALRYQRDDNDNERAALDGEIIQHDTYSADLFSGILTSETRFGDKLMMNFGYLFTTMDTDTDGSFRQSEDHNTHVVTKNFITGGANFQQHVVNSSLWWNPLPDLVIAPSVRAEWEDTDASSGFGTILATPATFYSSTTDILNTNEEIELRYTGFDNIVLYANAEWMQGDEDLVIRQETTSARHLRDGDIDTDFQKYTVGTNWYPWSRVSISTQYYYSQLDQDLDYNYKFSTGSTPTLDGILSGHAVETNDFNIRVTWRAMNNLTFTTRYDYKCTEIENESYWNAAATLPTPPVTSGEITSHILSESAMWNVTERVYVQGSVQWISSETDTPTNTGYNSLNQDLVGDWDNDYLCVSVNAGYALSKNTDILFGYMYSNADNYLNDASVTVPYGTVSQEHMFTVSMIQRINENMTANIRYGWFRGDDDAAGGFNDYEAHMVSTGLQVRF